MKRVSVLSKENRQGQRFSFNEIIATVAVYKKNKRLFTLLTIFSLLCIVATLLVYLQTSNTVIVVLLGVLGVVAFIAGLVFSSKSESAEKVIDSYVSRVAHDVLDEQFTGTPVYATRVDLNRKEHKQKRVELKETTLFAKYDTVDMGVNIVGDYRGRPVEYQELHLTKTVKESKGDTKKKTVFQGGFITVSGVNPSLSQTRLYTRFHSWKKANKFTWLEPKTENSKFHDQFMLEINNENPHDVFYVFTPHFMERVQDFADRNPAFAVMWNEGILYVAFLGNNDVFSYSMDEEQWDESALREKFTLQLRSYLDIVDFFLDNRSIFPPVHSLPNEG